MSKQEPVPPYNPINIPVREIVSFNDADFHTVLWPVPEGVSPNGRIIFVHGFSEYDAVYFRIFDELSRAGYDVFFFDQRGAGRTSPGKGKGSTNEFHSFNDLDFFIERNLAQLKETNREQKFFLAGHSMGGGISLNYGVNGKYKDKIRGIVVTGPLILLHPGSRPSRVVWYLSKFLLKIMPNYKIDTALNPEFITSDKEWNKFANDNVIIKPLIGSLRMVYDFITRGEKLIERDYVKDFTPPVFIIHGKEDKINDPEASKIFIDLIPIEDKKLSIVEGGYHSLFIEAEPIYNAVRDDVLEWLEKH